jgi:hypothetical protein
VRPAHVDELLQELRPRSPEARAALACFLGDLEEAASLLARRGRRHRREGDVLLWPREGELPAGGIAAGSDPMTAVVVLLFALHGPLWPHLPEARQAMEEARRLYGRARKMAAGCRPAPGQEYNISCEHVFADDGRQAR